MTRARAVRCAAALALALTVAVAHAQQATPVPPPPQGDPPAGVGAAEPYAVAQSERPLTLSRLTLRAGLGASVTRYPNVAVGVAFGFGVTDDVEVGAGVGAQLAPSVQYENPSVYGVGRFFHSTDVQLGVSGYVAPPLLDDSPFAFGVGVPVWLGGRYVQLRSGLFYGAAFFTATGDNTQRFDVPLVLVVSPWRELWLSLDTGAGVGLARVSSGAPGTTTTWLFPLGVSLGITVPVGSRPTPLVDFVASFSFPLFVTAGSAGGSLGADAWVASFGVRGYFTL